MSIARGVRKAAKAAKKQSRGLTGKRNSQGDFIPEDIQTKGVQEAVAPDLQNYIDDVRRELDAIDASREKLSPNDYEGHMKYLEEKEGFIKDVIQELEDNNVAVPKELTRELDINALEQKRVNDSLGPEWANDNANEEPYDIDMTDEEKGIRYAQPARRGYGMDDESLY